MKTIEDDSEKEPQSETWRGGWKILLLRVVGLICIFQFAFQSLTFVFGSKPRTLARPSPGRQQQDLVTWDEHSLFVRGERIIFYSGEFHPFRLPVVDLWLDVFQKIKSLGYNGVSFYINWALHEGTEGTIRADGIFAWEPFFDAAAEAGIYLLARPGPYINAEVSGGGFPGWVSRVKGTLRTNVTDYLSATDLYIQAMGKKIVEAQITNGGPVILYQPENEYTYPYGDVIFPNLDYFGYVMEQAINSGISVPIISNDAAALGYFAPGNTSFQNVTVDIYGHDGYPLGFDCSNPNVWPDNSFPLTYTQLHIEQSPSTAYSLIEYQGGSYDPWGGPGFVECNKLINSKFERVFYKNTWASGVTIFNQYMIYGGTNWGNLGHPSGYTSYDYAAVIAEDRSVSREKYSEAKLQANFLKCSPAYLTSVPDIAAVNGSYVSTDNIAVTRLRDSKSGTNMYIIRQAAYNSNQTTKFTVTVPTSIGMISIPQITQFASELLLDGRDSKVLVTNYKVGSIDLIYSSAEIFTWKTYGSKTILVLYGGAGETHEFALPPTLGRWAYDGSKIATQVIGDSVVVQWQVTPIQQTFAIGSLTVYLLWRNDAYNWWDIELPAASPILNYSSPSKQSVLVKGPYLVRTANIQRGDLYLTGELNATTSIQVIGSPAYRDLYWNNAKLDAVNGKAFIDYVAPKLTIPDLASLEWKGIDTLPELSSSYSDASWSEGDHITTNNPLQPSSQFVLYASDYGFHTGPLLYRGHFTSLPSTSQPLTLSLYTAGGYAYGYQVYLNSSLLYTFPGISVSQNHSTVITLPQDLLKSSTPYTFTVIIDHTGLDENYNPGLDSMKNARGILSYNLTSGSDQKSQIPISWKLTGNLGGENYHDLTRGPLNEGGLHFERQGYHLPGAQTSPDKGWFDISDGLSTDTSPSLHPSSSSSSSTTSTYSSITFYTTNFSLSLPYDTYDIPLQFTFTNITIPSTSSSSSSSRSSSVTSPQTAPIPFRANLYINGYQFGKYINHIGPQTSYPVPEGILNYQGENYLGVYVWDMRDPGVAVTTYHPDKRNNRSAGTVGAKEELSISLLSGFKLEQSSTATYFGPGENGRRAPRLSGGMRWVEREGAY